VRHRTRIAESANKLLITTAYETDDFVEAHTSAVVRLAEGDREAPQRYPDGKPFYFNISSRFALNSSPAFHSGNFPACAMAWPSRK
jgi:hypothetical protein